MRLAEIFSAHWRAYGAKFGRWIPAERRAAVRAIRRCRTAALGGQHYRCGCGREHYAYHSCNHRACPRCGQDDAAAWLKAQRTRLLPVPGVPCSTRTAMNDLAPAYYTGSRLIRVPAY